MLGKHWFCRNFYEWKSKSKNKKDKCRSFDISMLDYQVYTAWYISADLNLIYASTWISPDAHAFYKLILQCRASDGFIVIRIPLTCHYYRYIFPRCGTYSLVVWRAKLQMFGAIQEENDFI